MKNLIQSLFGTFKKGAIIVGLAALPVCSFAQSQGQPVMRWLPLLNGYNVLVQSNIVSGITPGFNQVGESVGSTNVVYSSYAGSIYYSLTNNVFANGALNSNSVAPDAFKAVNLTADVNGDINANAALWYCFGNTNYIPIAITNNAGQWFVPNGGLITNYSTAAWATIWPLSSGTPINWMYPATTNYYPIFDGTATNTVTIALYAVGTPTFKGGDADPIGMPPLIETTSTFSFTLTFAGNAAMVAGSTNLPTGFLQHAKKVYAVVSLPANMTTNKITSGLLVTGGLLLNNLGILQPQ